MPRDNKPTSAIDMLICPAAGSGPQRVWTLGGVKQTTQHMGSARGDDSGMRQCLFNELHGIKRKSLSSAKKVFATGPGALRAYRPTKIPLERDITHDSGVFTSGQTPVGRVVAGYSARDNASIIGLTIHEVTRRWLQ